MIEIPLRQFSFSRLFVFFFLGATGCRKVCINQLHLLVFKPRFMVLRVRPGYLGI